MITLASLLLLAAAPQAPSLCFPRDALVQTLASQHQERLAVSGLSEQGFVVEIYGSEAGTWTLVLVTSNGAACLLDAGTGLRVVPDRIGAPT